jgi:hypothetical protein
MERLADGDTCPEEDGGSGDTGEPVARTGAPRSAAGTAFDAGDGHWR